MGIGQSSSDALEFCLTKVQEVLGFSVEEVHDSFVVVDVRDFVVDSVRWWEDRVVLVVVLDPFEQELDWLLGGVGVGSVVERRVRRTSDF
jgi:hypothetical protein